MWTTDHTEHTETRFTKRILSDSGAVFASVCSVVEYIFIQSGLVTLIIAEVMIWIGRNLSVFFAGPSFDPLPHYSSLNTGN